MCRAALFFATFIPVLLAAPARGAPGELASGLDLLARHGALTAEDHSRLLAQLAAQPDAGPAGPAAHGCATALLAEAKAFARSRGAAVQLAPLPSEGHLDSALFPIRVHYQTAALLDEAQLVLEASERAWTEQVVQLGYRAPFTVDDQQQTIPGIFVYVVGSYGYAGFTEPLGDVAATPLCDCSVRLIINGSGRPDQIVSTVHHEVNHAVQAATDCAETASAWEGFAAATEFAAGGRSDPYLIEMMGEFQRYPEYPLDYFTTNTTQTGVPSDMYNYGAALFPLFLVDRFGGGDLRLLREAWESFAQPGTMRLGAFGLRCSAGNTPDWFEGLDAALAARGSSLMDAFAEFSAWRAIVGAHDDGAHFSAGARLPPPATETTPPGRLPARGRASAREYASHFVALDPSSFPSALRVTVDGSPEAHWSGSLLLWRTGSPVERIPLAFTAAHGEASAASMSGVTRAVLVASHVRDSAHSTDALDYATVRELEYAFEDATPADDPGCGCGATGAPGPAALLFALTSVAAALRSRSHAAARRDGGRPLA